VTLEEVAGRIEGVGVGNARRLLVALRQTRRTPAIGAEEVACAVEFGNDMPAIVEKVVARAGCTRLLPCPQTVGSIASGEGSAELRQAVFGVPGKRRVDACPVIQGRIALPVVGRSDQLVVVVVGEQSAAQGRQVVGSVGGVREGEGDEQAVVAVAVCRAYAVLAGQTILIVDAGRIVSIAYRPREAVAVVTLIVLLVFFGNNSDVRARNSERHRKHCVVDFIVVFRFAQYLHVAVA